MDHGYDNIANDYKKIQEKSDLILCEEAKTSLVPFLNKLPTGSKVIDVGCATGFYTQIISNNPKVSYCVGLDISEKMIYLCWSSGIKADFVVNDFLSYEFKEKEKFDCAVMRAFIHIFPKSDVKKIFLKCKEILKNRGYIIVSTSIHESGSEGYEVKEFHSEFKRYRARYTYDELMKLLQNHFEILDVVITYDVTSKLRKKWANVFARIK